MKFRRWRYITDASYQLKSIFLFAIVSFLGSIVAVASFNFFALKKLETLIWSTHINVKTTGDIVNTVFIYVNISSFLFVSVLLIIASVGITKKTAGPLYRISKDIHKVTQGDLTTHIALRQKDEFQDVAYELDSMLQNIKERFNIIRNRYMNISGSLTGFNKKTGAAETDIIILNSALLDIENIEKEISTFKLRKRQ